MIYQVHLKSCIKLLLKCRNVNTVITWIVSIYFLGIQFCHRVQRVFYRLREKPRLYCRYNTQQCIKNDSLFAFIPLGEHASEFAHLFVKGSTGCPLHFGSSRNFSSNAAFQPLLKSKRTAIVLTAFSS